MLSDEDRERLEWRPPTPGPYEIVLSRRIAKDTEFGGCTVAGRHYRVEPPIPARVGDLVSIHYGYLDDRLRAVGFLTDGPLRVGELVPDDAAPGRERAEIAAGVRETEDRMAAALGVPVESLGGDESC